MSPPAQCAAAGAPGSTEPDDSTVRMPSAAQFAATWRSGLTKQELPTTINLVHLAADAGAMRRKPELPPNASYPLMPTPAQRAASGRDQAEAATENFVYFDAVAGALRRIGALSGLTKPELPPTKTSPATSGSLFFSTGSLFFS